ncbi:lipopolysaccharide biosynthesis protein [Aquabacter spiritensis]|uniref:O-antigen/teichoic acid export membrane protein n=1 Tax=Aquabacter spiritensis TaxID=933073 RepID=A0A4R3M2X8_9HYPH|nr:oligosaccharide flippase family protein [Aquabacter spiritensis]TCT06579.1 O-antigen/teichoic acid export membrane protein [Aquabacter spiritensis]
MPALRESLYYAFGLVAGRAISLLMLPVNTHFLALAEYGRLEVLMALADVGALVFGLALPTTLSRFVGTAETWEKRREVCAHIFAVAILTSAVLTLVGFAAAGEIARLLPGDPTATEVRLLVVTLSMEGLLGVGLTWLRIRSKARTFFLLSIGRGLVFAVLSASLLVLGFGLPGVLAAGAVASVLQGVAVGVVVLRETGVRVRGIDWGPLMIFSGPLLLSALAMFALGSLDRWFLADAVGTDDLAIYGVAVRIGAMTAVLLQPFHMWWFPKRFIVLFEPDGVERSARIVVLGLIITLLGAMMVSLGGPLVIRLLTPPAYHPAILFIPWIALIYAIQETASLLELGSFLRKDGFVPLATNTFGAVIVVALYWLLIPPYGIAGAIAATLAAQTARAIVIHVVSQYYKRLPYAFGPLAIVVGFGTASTALCYLMLPPGLLVVGGAIAVPLTAACAYWLGVIALPAPPIAAADMRRA